MRHAYEEMQRGIEPLVSEVAAHRLATWLLHRVGWLAELESATFGVRFRRSGRLSYSHSGPERLRTASLDFARVALSLLSYRPMELFHKLTSLRDVSL